MILRRYRIPLAVIAANVVFATSFVTVTLSGFHQPRPHDIPVGIVAPATTAQTIQSNLDVRIAGGFDLRLLPTARRARAAIEDRRVDGALIVLPQGLTLLTAEAGGTGPTQVITTAFAAIAAKTGRALSTTDVVAPLRSDSQGLSAYFLILCVLFPSLATGVAAGHVMRRAALAARIGVLVLFAGLAGLASAGIADGISGLGHYWALAGIVALFSLAISAPAAGLVQIKPHLVALCVLAFLIFGIPVSGGPANLAAFEPGFLRSLHPGLPLGIAVDSIRNTVYFHASDTTGHLWVLTAYAAAGVAALCLGIASTWRRERNAPAVTVPGTAGGPAAPETVPAPIPAAGRINALRATTGPRAGPGMPPLHNQK